MAVTSVPGRLDYGLVNMTTSVLREYLPALWLVAAISGLTACSMKPVNVDTLPVRYPTAPQPDQVQEPLLVVLDPALVPETMRTADPQTKKIDIRGVQTFVRRDVKNVLGDFFVRVDVVGPAQAARDVGYVAEVRVTRIDTTAETGTSIGTNGVAIMHRAFGVIDWSIVIRDAETAQVVYSFSDRATGTFALTNVNESEAAISSAIEAAMVRFGKDLRDRNVPATLRAYAEAKARARTR
jgi:hypothetical protein